MTPIRIFPAAWAVIFAALVAIPAASRAQTSTSEEKPGATAAPAKPRAKPAAKPAAPAATTVTPHKPAAPAATTAKPQAKPAAKPNAPAATTAKPQPTPPAPAATTAKPQPKPAAATTKPQPKPPEATPSAAPAPGSDQPTLLGQYGEWGAYTASPDGKKICFTLAKPGSSQTNPSGRPRDPAFLLVSTRPAEKVKDEVSVIIGYSFKPNSEATAGVGSTNFTLYTQSDGAWVKDAADEAKMVEAMRKGADVVVKGESGRGTKTTDTFSLKGLPQALDRVGQECK